VRLLSEPTDAVVVVVQEEALVVEVPAAVAVEVQMLKVALGGMLTLLVVVVALAVVVEVEVGQVEVEVDQQPLRLWTLMGTSFTYTNPCQGNEPQSILLVLIVQIRLRHGCFHFVAPGLQFGLKIGG
jgi:hypothetical protein